MWWRRKPFSADPRVIRIIFAPTPMITAFELATILSGISGTIEVLREPFYVDKEHWNMNVPESLKRHFVVLP